MDHFIVKEKNVITIYKNLIAKILKFGPLKIEPKKTSIHLGNRYGFAGVYTRKDYLNLELHLDYKLTKSRVTKVEQASKNRFHHTIKLTDAIEVDSQLVGWLKASYTLKK